MALSLFLSFLLTFSDSYNLSLLFPPLSPYTHTEGRLEVNMSEVSLEEMETSLLEGEPSKAPGGYWKPKDCLPRWKVSVNATLLKGQLAEKAMSNTQTDGIALNLLR